MKVWAYIHPELNILCCALFKESVPEGVSTIEFEVESHDQINDIVYDGTQIRFKTLEEKLQEEKIKFQNLRKQKVASLLAQTDYVITKISDLKTQLELGIINSDAYTAEIQKYLSVLQERHNIRDWNVNIETRIQNATTLDELEQIKTEIISYTGQFEE
jgi:hypothetical protein